MARKRGPVSIVTIAEELGISPAAVSRVINNYGYISEKTRKTAHKAQCRIPCG